MKGIAPAVILYADPVCRADLYLPAVIIHGSYPVSRLPPDEVAALRAANALLREVIEARTPRALRRRSGRKPGWPKGQPGATLEMTDRPDEAVSHEPDR